MVEFRMPSGFEKTDIEHISPINWKALDKLSARKKIHAKTVNANVTMIATKSLKFGKILPAATISMLFLFVLKIIDGRMNNACSKPQTINVQFAPCQNPLTRKMINVFRIRIQFPPLLPLLLSTARPICIRWYTQSGQEFQTLFYIYKHNGRAPHQQSVYLSSSFFLNRLTPLNHIVLV